MESDQKSVLIIEDDDMLRSILVKKFVGQYDVYQARDGSIAMQEITARRPNIILLDLMLPVMDGFEVLKQLRANPNPDIANTPVVVLSNLFDMRDILRTQTFKVAHYYVKAQTDMDTVVQKVGELLA